ERIRDGVDLGDVETAARPDEVGDDLGPAPDVGDTAEHAARGVDEVEVVREADLGGGPRREIDCGLAEVGAGDARPEARPRQRVNPEVALEVEQLQPADVADLLELVLAEPDSAALEAR